MKKRILVFSVGQLGDTIATIPSLWAIRKQHKNSWICLLCNNPQRSFHVCAKEILHGTSLVDSILLYNASDLQLTKFVRVYRIVSLLIKLRQLKFDMLVYLIQPYQLENRIHRDKMFFKLAGIKDIVGMDIATELPAKVHGKPLPVTLKMADIFLARLKSSGIIIEPPDQGCMNLLLGKEEDKTVDAWLQRQSLRVLQNWVGIGIGSKMPAKIWSLDRWKTVIETLVEKYDIWPVFFGGLEDTDVSISLQIALGRGYVGAGQLGIRAAAAALRRCEFYLGHDTGTMHLAAVVGIPCVAVFSARDYPGLWYPYGQGHTVLRYATNCEGCMREICVQEDNKCLKQISPAAVIDACETILKTKSVDKPIE